MYGSIHDFLLRVWAPFRDKLRVSGCYMTFRQPDSSLSFQEVPKYTKSDGNLNGNVCMSFFTVFMSFSTNFYHSCLLYLMKKVKPSISQFSLIQKSLFLSFLISSFSFSVTPCVSLMMPPCFATNDASKVRYFNTPTCLPCMFGSPGLAALVISLVSAPVNMEMMVRPTRIQRMEKALERSTFTLILNQRRK